MTKQDLREYESLVRPDDFIGYRSSYWRHVKYPDGLIRSSLWHRQEDGTHFWVMSLLPDADD